MPRQNRRGEKKRAEYLRRREAQDRLTAQAAAPTVRPEGCPSGKVAYDSPSAFYARSRRMEWRSKCERAYRCTFCGLWHGSSSNFDAASPARVRRG